jgi:hypothetical protein
MNDRSAAIPKLSEAVAMLDGGRNMADLEGGSRLTVDQMTEVRWEAARGPSHGSHASHASHHSHVPPGHASHASHASHHSSR